ncbi:MAG: hypothetical protein MUO22_09250, partial [Sedimentisphaerales bacterium]|nr:hypothetical protein [Sedimentisphaerales bacterium]
MRNILLIMVLSVVLTSACFGKSQCSQGKSPLDDPPPYIKRVTHFGQRADFSHDGKRLLFIEKTFGDVYEVELATGI